MSKSPCLICDKKEEDKSICSKDCKKLKEYQTTLPPIREFMLYSKKEEL